MADARPPRGGSTVARSRRGLVWALALLACGWGAAAPAHVSGYTDTSIQISASGVRLIYTLPSDNLAELDGARAPVAAASPARYLARVRDGWQVRGNGERCLLAQSSANALSQLPSYQFQFTYACPAGVDQLEFEYSLFFASWPEHENFTRVFLADQRQRLRFTRDHQRVDIPVARLLAQWGRQLEPGFFGADPNHGLATALAGQESALPARMEPAPSFGALDFRLIDPGFLRLGAEHIFTGLDHLLFVAGLVLITPAWRRLLVLITAFTLAHSLTLALSTWGAISVPGHVAEPLIALTILYVGLEGLWMLRRGTVGESRVALARRAILVFGFGLVHGVGFSYVLRAMGLREDLLGSLLYFNAGVELGQLAIIAATVPLLLWLRRLRLERWLTVGGSGAIACCGALMLLARL